MYKIYELIDPRDVEYNPRYIGYTSTSLKARLQEHMKPSRLAKNNYRANWIRSLREVEITPEIRLIEEVDTLEKAWEREKFWIKTYRLLGHRLANATDGGAGSVGYNPTKETRAKIAVNSAKRTMSEDNKQKLIAANKGRKFTEEHRRKLSIAKKGLPAHPNSLKAIREGTIRSVIAALPDGTSMEFESLVDCAKYFNGNPATLCNCIKKKRLFKKLYAVTYKNESL